MKANINPDTSENKLNGRRSILILKRQDTCLSSEGADENTEGPRTPRRVSFAKSAMVRYMNHLGDDSSSTICSSSDSSTGSSQSLGHDSMFLPGPVPTPQERCESAFTDEISTASMHQQHVKASNTVLTNMQVNPSHSSLGSESEKNKTILYKSMNMSMANISQISQSVSWQDGHEEMNKRCFTVRQQEAQNRTIMFTDLDEYDGCMEMTSTISDTSPHADDNFHQNDFLRKVEYQSKPGLNRRPSFADEGTSDDQVFMEIGSSRHQSAPDCTIIFNNSGEGDMESTQYLTQPVSFPYHSSGLCEGIVFKPKPKLLDDLSSLIKTKEPPDTASFKTQDVTVLGATDMEITEEITHIVSRSALSDITTYKGLAPIEEMSLVSMNASLADQENRLACGVLQSGAHLTKLNKVNTTLEQIYGVHFNSIPLKPEMAFDKAVISPENKENFPIGSIYNPYVERQTTVSPDLQTSNLQFDASSRCSMVKENNSSSAGKATSSFIKGNIVNKSPETDNNTSVIISFPSRAERALDMVKEKSKAATYVSPVDGEVNIKREAMLQKQDLEGNATILFNNSADIELTETEMTTHTGQMNPNGKNYRHYAMANDNSQIPESSVTLQEPQFYVRRNTQMKMAQDTSRTIYVGNMSIDCSDGGFNASKNISEQYSKYPHNSQMEITHGLSKPIFLEGNGNECPSKAIGKSNIYKTSEDLDTNQMEVTQGLSKTIYLGEKGKEYPSTNNIYKTSEDLDTKQMEVTQGLSKTIYPGEKDKECTSRPTNNIYKTSEDLDTKQMEVTQGLSKTIYLGEKDKECTSRPTNNIYKTSEDLDTKQMEVTQGLSKTIYLGEKDKECTSRPTNNIYKTSEDLDTKQMEVTQGLSKTIYLGEKDKECTSRPTNNIYKTSEDLDTNQMEVTQGLSKTIYLGEKDKECTSRPTNNIYKTSEDLDTNQMEVTQGLSKTIYLGEKDKECTSRPTNNIYKTREDLDTNQMEVTQGLSKTIYLGEKGKEYPSTNNIYKTSEDLDTKQMEVTQGLSKTIYLGEKDKECTSRPTNNIYKTSEDLDTKQMEVTQGLSKTIYLGEKDKECTSRPTNNIYKTSEDLDTNQTQNHSRTSFLGGFGSVYPARNICENNKCSEETYSNQNSSHMEMTNCLSKIIFPGDKDTECHKKLTNESTQVSAGNKYSDTNQEEMSGTIYSQASGHDCQSHTLSESKQCSQESKDFHTSHMEHKAYEEQYYLKEMNSEFPGQVVDEGSQYHGELFKKPYNSQVEMSRGGTQQSLVSEMEAANSSKSSPRQLENASMLTVKGCQRNIEPVATMTNLQGNAPAEVIDQKRALQQALIKEIGFPLSSLSRTSAAFDPFQRRKSCSKDLFFSKGKVWSGKEDKMSNSLVSAKRSMLGVNTPGESTSNYLSSVNCTDPNGTFRAMKNHNDQSTSTYEQIGSSFCLGKFDKPESTEEARLQIRSADSNADFLGSFKVSPSAAVKLSASTPSHADKHYDHLGFSDLLFHQEMPELADDSSDVSAAEDHFEFGDGTILSDIEFLTGKGRKFNLQDVYESLGVSRLERTDAKKVHTQNVASTTLREKLLATVIDVSRLGCLKQHVSEIEATISRSKQDSAESLIQFTFKPPELLMGLLTNEYVPELRTKTQKMIQSCRISALAKWKQLKTGHLWKFSGQLEASSQALKIQIGSIISETDKVLDLISNIDQNLQEIEVLCGQKQELSIQQKRLEETERETQQLRTYYMEMNDRAASLTRTNKETVELVLNAETAKASIDEQISWTSSFVEWTIMRRTDREIHFGFLFNTLILEVGLIDCGGSHPNISKVSLQSRLGAKSKPWAKLAHSWAVSCIDCYQLQSSYKNYDQMHKLLTNVSSVICEARQLNTELRLVHLKHGLSIDDNRMRVTVSNRKTRQKILLDATISWYPHPQSPLVWNVSTIIGSVLPKDVKPSIDRIEGGPKYITRVLSQAVQILSQHKG